MKTFFIFLFVILLCGCPTYDPISGVLSIANNSDSAVYVYHTCSDSLQKQPELKLFLESGAEMIDARGNKMETTYSPDYRINAHSTSEMSGFGTAKYKRLPCGNQEFINLFFISESAMRKYTWDEIAQKQLYLNKMKVTKQHLDSLDWKIKYRSEQSND